VLPVVLVGLGMGLIGVIVGYLLATLIAVVVGATLLVWRVDWLRTKSSGSVKKSKLLRYSLPLVFAGVSFSLVSQVDYFVIGYFMSSSDVAQYRVAWLLTANVLMVHMATGSIIKPMVAEEIENDSLIRARFQLATRWASILTVPIALTMMLAPGTYLSLLFTPEYAEAGLVVMVLCAGYLFNAMTGPKGMVLEGLGFTRLSLLNSIILLVFNSGINVLLIPRIGILGAAIGSATGMILMSAAGIVEIFYTRGIQPYSSSYVRIVVAIVPTVILGRLLVTNVSETVVVAALLPVTLTVVYVVSIKLLRGFTDKDEMIAEAIDSRLGYRVVAPIIG
jgi:O-antigen/teichoic acid export membrane protein